MKVRIKRLREEASLPRYTHGPSEDAGLDLCAVEDTMLPPGAPKLVPTGIAIELPPGYEAQIRPRSGLALKHGLTMINSPGTIDSDYRGEIQVIAINLGTEPLVIQRGQRIAQMVVQRVVRAQWREVDELPVSARHDGGFGHTDKE